MLKKVCRTCLKEISNKDYIKLNNSSESLDIQAELQFCIPEVNFYLIENAYMCNECSKSLHSSYLFKNSCLRSEERYRNYVQLKNGVNVTLEDLCVNSSESNITNFQQDILDDLNNILDEVLQQNESNNFIADEVKDKELENKDKPLDSNIQPKVEVDEKLPPLKLPKLKLLQEKTQLVCKFCNKLFLSKFLLHEHVKSVHRKKNKKSKKTSTPKKAVTPVVKKNSTISKTVTPEFRCNICNYVGKRRDYVKDHIRRQHRTFRMVRCLTNGYKCALQQFKCAFCDYVGDCQDLQMHTSAVHMNDSAILVPKSEVEGDTCVCHICDKSFSDPQHLNLHIEKHAEQNEILKVFLPNYPATDVSYCTEELEQSTNYQMTENSEVV